MTTIFKSAVKHTLSMPDTTGFKDKALHWVSRCSPFVFLDSCGYADPYGKYEWIAACGTRRTFESWDLLQKQEGKHWLFGHLSYEAHRQMNVFSDALPPEENGIPQVHFFEPETVIFQRRGSSEVEVWTEGDAAEILAAVDAISMEEKPLPKGFFKRDFEQEAYCKIIQKLRRHIYEGDCYEINFCNRREGFLEHSVSPIDVFLALRRASPAPFAACYGFGEKWLVCASPERYLTGEGAQLISQPIKGTAPRFAEAKKDEAARHALQTSAKDRAENVMIVDLTRSDFARVCKPGSVEVNTLFEVQSFPQVHQLVSTVSGELLPEKTFWDAVETSFPMGSMTGAPRQKVMDLIRLYESRERGFFSGSVGFCDPEGHADLNVVIRSLWGRGEEVFFNTGGAITWSSTPEGEWEECLLKGRAIERLFL